MYLFQGALAASMLFAISHSQFTDVPGFFFPFGEAEGDAVLGHNDDSFSEPINITTHFRFFNSTYNQVFVNTNGILSFNAGVSTYTPSPFPIASQPVVAVFWADVDTTEGGDIYYREIIQGDLLGDITDEILSVYAPRGLYYFRATWAFMATYYNVGAFGGANPSHRNTFQVVIATDGTHSFTVYHYGRLEWTYGTSSSGTDAQVGFDAGDSRNYFAVPVSRTPDIIRMNSTSNAGLPGRWIFRIDQAQIDTGEGCDMPGNCNAHEQELDDGSCVAIAPAIQECPTLRGPELVENSGNSYVYFYCEITQDTNASEIYSIRFLFNNDQDFSVPETVLEYNEETYLNNISIPLHEKYLRGHMGQWVSCEVQTHYVGSDVRSTPVQSPGYWVGVKPSEYTITVHESDDEPTNVHLISTVPISCQSPQCYERFLIDSSSVLLVYQAGRPEEDSDSDYNCAYYLYSGDWNETEMESYRRDLPLQLITVRTAYNEPDLVEFIRFSPNYNLQRTKVDENGGQYQSMWTDYEPQHITVYRVDEDLQAGASCAATGDPRMNTLDGRVYSMYAWGQFVMLRSTSNRRFEVQIRTYECAQTLSCTCAVAVREGNETLILDMCGGLRSPYRIVRFANGADQVQKGRIDVDQSGRRYTIKMESGAFVNVYTFHWGMNVLVHVLGQDYGKTLGLCGTYNNNPQDDFVIQGTNGQLDETNDREFFVSSWRIQARQSYFERNPSLVIPNTEPVSSFCTCADNTEEIIPCGEVVDRDSFNYMTFNDVETQPLMPPSANFVSKRRKRAAGENPEYEVETNYDPDNFDFAENTTNIREFTWPTPSGITEDEARQRCIEAIVDGSCDIEPEVAINGVEGGNAMTISKCMLDVKETDSFEWIADKLGEAQFTCINAAVRSVVVTSQENETSAEVRERISSSVRSVVSDVTQNICPNQCSGNGQCVDSTCMCDQGWTAVDCSINTASRPDVLGFLHDEPICDITEHLCRTVRMLTHNVFSSPALRCKVEISETDRAVLTDANLQGISEVICTLPDHATLMADHYTTVLTYNISITRDGINYGEEGTYRVYHGSCTLCTDAVSECTELPEDVQASECDDFISGGTKFLPHLLLMAIAVIFLQLL